MKVGRPLEAGVDDVSNEGSRKEAKKHLRRERK
jgi:hypothetical protein